MDERLETARTLDDCREAVVSLRLALQDPLVLAGMDAARARGLARHLDGALGVLDEAAQSTPAYKLVTLLDGAPRVAPVHGRRLTVVK
jgi:hypothetical protein